MTSCVLIRDALGAVLIVTYWSSSGMAGPMTSAPTHDTVRAVVIITATGDQSATSLLKQAVRRTADKWRREGADFEVWTTSEVEEWVRRERPSLSKSVTCMQSFRFAKSRRANMLATIGFAQGAPRTRHYTGWLLDLQTGGVFHAAPNDLGDEVLFRSARGQRPIRRAIDGSMSIRDTVPNDAHVLLSRPPWSRSRRIMGAVFDQRVENGLRIDRVLRGSPLAAVGAITGDLVVGVNDSPVRRLEELVSVVERSRESVIVRVIRDGVDAQWMVQPVIEHEFFSKSFSDERQLMDTQEINTADGRRFLWNQLTNRVCVISFWATWCGPCVTELPVLETLSACYGNSMSWVSVSVDKDAGRWQAFVEQNDLGGLQIRHPALADACGVTSLPALLIMKADGTVVACDSEHAAECLAFITEARRSVVSHDEPDHVGE